MLKLEKRPNCPRCGTPNPIKHGGTMWWCKKCGRSWVVYPSPKPKIKSPPCKYCPSSHVISYGDRWRCRKCGKSWAKIYVSSLKKVLPVIFKFPLEYRNSLQGVLVKRRGIL